MASQKTKLEALQKQQPPTDPDELVQYLMKRLEAAEQSLKVQEDVINKERELRKASAKFLKVQNNSLKELVEKEKRNLSDKVSAELDATLKQAVKEKVELKIEFDKQAASKIQLEREYQELQDMYNNLKETQKQNEVFNEES